MLVAELNQRFRQQVDSSWGTCQRCRHSGAVKAAPIALASGCDLLAVGRLDRTLHRLFDGRFDIALQISRIALPDHAC